MVRVVLLKDKAFRKSPYEVGGGVSDGYLLTGTRKSHQESKMSVCIAEYKDDIISAVSYMSSLAVSDSLTHKEAYRQIINNNMADEVAEWIVGDPDEDIELVELYYAISAEAKKQFKIRLLGIY